MPIAATASSTFAAATHSPTTRSAATSNLSPASGRVARLIIAVARTPDIDADQPEHVSGDNGQAPSPTSSEACERRFWVRPTIAGAAANHRCLVGQMDISYLEGAVQQPPKRMDRSRRVVTVVVILLSSTLVLPPLARLPDGPRTSAPVFSPGKEHHADPPSPRRPEPEAGSVLGVEGRASTSAEVGPALVTPANGTLLEPLLSVRAGYSAVQFT